MVEAGLQVGLSGAGKKKDGTPFGAPSQNAGLAPPNIRGTPAANHRPTPPLLQPVCRAISGENRSVRWLCAVRNVWAVTRVAITIDLNADVGEGCGQDAALMPLISSANIACGIHAGDNDSMRDAVALALEHGVAIGAHPSFPDREHFGRREMQLDARELHQCIVAQIESLANVAAAAGAQLRHVKPHGALYNMAARDEAIAETVVAAIRSVDPALMMFGLAGSVMLTVAERLGLRAISEAFADRAYRPDGSLLPRNQQGSVLHDETAVAARAVAMVQGGAVIAVDGSHVAIRADTICLHGDSPGADVMALRIRDAFAAAGVRIVAPKERH